MSLEGGLMDTDTVTYRDTEVRVVDPKTGGEKGQKLARWDLLPVDALDEVAKVYGRGAAKYADRNWEKGYAYGLSYGAMMRHASQFWGGEDFDEETGNYHLGAVAFHALALLAFRLRGIGTDDRGRYLRGDKPFEDVDLLNRSIVKEFTDSLDGHLCDATCYDGPAR